MTRLDRGGAVDRSRTLRLHYDGIELTAHPGDTVASALLAAGHVEVAASTYRQRPRGILTADETEPNALVQVLDGAPEPLVPATELETYDGLQVVGQSGVGWLSRAPDPVVHDKKFTHTDVVVIGSGPAGLSAAQVAGRSGARVLLVERGSGLGGSLLDGDERIAGSSAAEWISDAIRELHEQDETRVLTRATAVGCYDHGYLLIAEQQRGSRRRLWHVRAQRIVLATGAHERPLVFADNDRPGIMLASAVRRYLTRYTVLPGRRAVVATTGDSAYRTVLELSTAGAQVPAVVDARQYPPRHLVDQARAAGARVLTGSAVVATSGDGRIGSARVRGVDERGALSGGAEDIACDLLAVSGGWNPAVQLFGQLGGTLRWDPVIAGFTPEQTGELPAVVGAARGTYDLAGCLAQGLSAGARAATASGFRIAAPPVPPVSGDRPIGAQRPLWLVPAERGEAADWTEHFVDLQRDATVADIRHAVDAGMRSVEHVKRYTTIGTGSDQGKTSAVSAIGVLAELLSAGSPGDVGATSFRPPYAPVSFATMAGRERGKLYDPVRTTPMHSWHVAAGAEFEDVGQWKRARYYPRAGEDMDAAVARECLAARTGVAMQDVSTLGRIEVVGPDAPEFLNRVYTNGFAKLPVGKARYGVMCTTDGMVFDDGVTLRLAEDRYLMSTTTGGAAGVLDWLEEWLQTEWTELAVHCTSVTEQWAAVALVGPDSREVLADLAPGLDVSAESFGFLQLRETALCNGIPARITRISFSGELAFEINVASWYGPALCEAVYQAGREYGITPYGTEAMHVLRAEKGLVIVGQDTDGTVTPHDLGMGWAVSQRKEFVGKRSFTRADTARTDRKQLVGLLPRDPTYRLPEGVHLVEPDMSLRPPVPMLGHVTSSYRSPVLDRTFALGLVQRGRERIGAVLGAAVGGRIVEVEVADPVFYDKQGDRRDGRQS